MIQALGDFYILYCRAQVHKMQEAPKNYKKKKPLKFMLWLPESFQKLLANGIFKCDRKGNLWTMWAVAYIYNFASI